jgi:hypothetical protein
VVTNVTNRFNQKKKQEMRLELYKQNQQKKLGITAEKDPKYETVDDRIVLYRHLGHFEIKNGYRWKLATSCWI